MWRREAHEEHGYFDAGMISAGDYEFWLRLAQNRKFLHVNETLGLYLNRRPAWNTPTATRAPGKSKIARDRYRDCIMAGKPPFRPQLAEPTAAVEIMTGAVSKPAPEPQPSKAAAPKSLPAVAQDWPAR